MKWNIFVTVLLMLLHPALLAQSVRKKTKFRIGEQLPAIAVNNLINTSEEIETIGFFRGKTVILYFGNNETLWTNHEWQKLKGFQQKFKNEIQIILIPEHENLRSARKIVRRQKRVTHGDMNLPVACGDTILTSLFPATSLPHLVWIDPAGKLMAITNKDQLNEHNLEDLAKGERPSLLQKDGIKHKVAFSKPLFVESNAGDGDHLEWQSVVSRYLPGVEAAMRLDSCTAAFSSFTVVTMLRYLFKGESNRFGALNLLPESRVDLRVKDTTKYSLKRDGVLQRDNLYTYQLYLKHSKDPRVVRAMALSDIKRYFGIDCYWSTQRKMCLVLGATDTTKFCYKSGEMYAFVRPTQIKLNNVTVKELFDNLLAFTDFHHSPYPLIDETGLKGTMGQVDAKTNVLDYRQLANALSDFGLTLSLQPREVEVLTVFETDFFTPENGAVIAN